MLAVQCSCCFVLQASVQGLRGLVSLSLDLALPSHFPPIFSPFLISAHFCPLNVSQAGKPKRAPAAVRAQPPAGRNTAPWELTREYLVRQFEATKRDVMRAKARSALGLELRQVRSLLFAAGAFYKLQITSLCIVILLFACGFTTGQRAQHPGPAAAAGAFCTELTGQLHESQT